MLYVNSENVQLYYGEFKLIFNERIRGGSRICGYGGREYARGLETLAGPGQNPYRDRKLGGFEELQTFI